MVSSTDSGGVRCRVEQRSIAPPNVVYDVLLDVARWPEWAPLVTAVGWDRAGEPETGLGGVRRVSSGGDVFRDRITASSRPHQHAYVTAVPEFWPYSDLRSDVRIHDDSGGSVIVWTSTCMARHAALANSIESKVAFIHSRWCAALAEEAERRAHLTRGDGAGEAVGQIA